MDDMQKEIEEELRVLEQSLETNIQQRDKAQKVVREIQKKINEDRKSIINIKRKRREAIIKIEKKNEPRLAKYELFAGEKLNISTGNKRLLVEKIGMRFEYINIQRLSTFIKNDKSFQDDKSLRKIYIFNKLGEGYTVSDVADMLELSSTRISQILVTFSKYLRHPKVIRYGDQTPVLSSIK